MNRGVLLMKTIAITGPTGSIGMALIKKCISEGVRVLAFVNPDSKRLDRIPDNPLVSVIKCGLDGLSGCCAEDDNSVLVDGDACLTKCDAFYHFAWAGTFGDVRNNMPLQEQNAAYVLDAVRLAKRMGAKVFIGAGSQAEYGRVEGLLTADTPANPENGYGIYKLKAGNDSRKLCKELGMVHIWTRILSVYGPYDGMGTMIMSTITKLLNGEKPSLTKGEQIWDYLYSDDAANAMFLLGQVGVREYNEKYDCAVNSDSFEKDSGDSEENCEKLTSAVDGNVYVIGSGIGRPLREYMEIMRDTINPDLELGIGEVPYGPKQVMHLQADISDLKRDTGFNPNYDFEEGIRNTIEYVRNNMLL